MSKNPSQPDPTPPPTIATAAHDPTDTTPHRPADDREEVYYEGSPLLRGHLGHLFLWTVLGLLFIGITVLAGIKHWNFRWYVTLGLVLIGIICFVVPILIVKRNRYRVTNYRVDFERGWLSTTIDTMEPWHVEDIKFHQTLLEKILGVGTIEIFSHDDTTPNLFMRGIPHARQLFSTLDHRIIPVKRHRGVLQTSTRT